MRKLFTIIMCLAFVSCAGISLKDDATTVLQQSATSTVGYLIAKNNPEYVTPIVIWYQVFQTKTELEDVQGAFRDGMAKLSSMVSEDPYLQLQINNAMNLLEISVEGPQTELELGKYQEVVDAFMSGVMVAPNTNL